MIQAIEAFAIQKQLLGIRLVVTRSALSFYQGLNFPVTVQGPCEKKLSPKTEEIAS